MSIRTFVQSAMRNTRSPALSTRAGIAALLPALALAGLRACANID